MLSGSILTLNFYSNPLDVIVDGNTVYVNWNHYQLMAGISLNLPHNLITLGGDEEPYVALSYLVNAKFDIEPNLGELIRTDFFSYITKELAVVRGLIPLIDLKTEEALSGIFDYKGRGYFTDDALKKLCLYTATAPEDLPRYPAVLSVVNPSSLHYGVPLGATATLLPVWIMDLDGLPYAIREANKPHTPYRSAALNDPGSLSEILLKGDPELDDDLVHVPLKVKSEPDTRTDMKYFPLSGE